MSEANQNSEVENCSVTGLPVCRRIFNMNLAFGYTEEFYSLQALAKKHDKSMEDIFDMGYDYVQGRECFRKEWDKMKERSECPLPNDCMIGKCFDE